MQRRHQQQHHHHVNGKFPSRLPPEPVSPYTPRKPLVSSGGGSHHPVIPNVPNLSYLHAGAASGYGKANHGASYQQIAMEKRKSSLESSLSNKDHQRRISEGDKVSMQQQQRIESGSSNFSKQQHSR
jgi:hypothetical protein